MVFDNDSKINGFLLTNAVVMRQ